MGFKNWCSGLDPLSIPTEIPIYTVLFGFSPVSTPYFLHIISSFLWLTPCQAPNFYPKFPLEFPPNGELVAGLAELGGGVEGEGEGEQVAHGFYSMGLE